MKLGMQEQPSSECPRWDDPCPACEGFDSAVVEFKLSVVDFSAPGLTEAGVIDSSVPCPFDSGVVLDSASVVFEVLDGQGGEQSSDLHGHFGQGTPRILA